MDVAEMVRHLEAIVRDESIPASSRVRGIEVLMRLGRNASPDDVEWSRIVREFGSTDAE